MLVNVQNMRPNENNINDPSNHQEPKNINALFIIGRPQGRSNTTWTKRNHDCPTDPNDNLIDYMFHLLNNR